MPEDPNPGHIPPDPPPPAWGLVQPSLVTLLGLFRPSTTPCCGNPVQAASSGSGGLPPRLALLPASVQHTETLSRLGGTPCEFQQDH
eukprot:2370960-Rhodomonas_salina.5